MPSSKNFIFALLLAAITTVMGTAPACSLKLDYLEWLGVDCIWLLPMYPSPLKDDGSDAASYYGTQLTQGCQPATFLGNHDELNFAPVAAAGISLQSLRPRQPVSASPIGGLSAGWHP